MPRNDNFAPLNGMRFSPFTKSPMNGGIFSIVTSMGAEMIIIKYLELNQDTTQSITAGEVTPVRFPNTVANSFNESLTISGTDNSYFTNNTTHNMYIDITATICMDSSSAITTNLWLSIELTRATLSNDTRIAISVPDPDFTNVTPQSVSGSVLLQHGDSFQIMVVTSESTVLGNTASTNGQIFRTALTVTQFPGF